jgi:hypothetical protein
MERKLNEFLVMEKLNEFLVIEIGFKGEEIRNKEEKK